MYIIPHLYVVKHLKFWKFEFSNVHTLNFQSFRIAHSWNCECFFSVPNRLLSIYVHYMSLLKSFVKMSFFYDRNFHFQKSLVKSKLKIGSNGFLIWFSWHSYMFKRNNVPLLPWFQMEKVKLFLKKLWQN
jgi:hypothetical protein